MGSTRMLLPTFAILLVLSPAVNGQNRAGLSLRETFDLYVSSIQKSDLATLFTTVTDNPHLIFLTSTGKMMNAREDYYKFHEEWFKEKEWEMPVDIVEVREGREYGYVTAIFHYKSKVEEGRTYGIDSYFTLIFHKENGMWKVVTDVCTPIERFLTEGDPAIRYRWDQVHFFDIIKNRRTVRKFKSTPIPREHILKILEAAHFAPTAGNQQPWKFLVVQNRAKLDRLKEEAASWYLEAYKSKARPDEAKLAEVRDGVQKALDGALSAPVYVAVLVDSKARYPQYIMIDGTLAASHLMLAARALGYGTGFFTTFFPEDRMKAFFDIPDRYRLICFTPIGMPDEWPNPPIKKDLRELIVFEKF
jgi:nitroreductase/ketosteroid isomerase-like protein